MSLFHKAAVMVLVCCSPGVFAESSFPATPTDHLAGAWRSTG